MKNIKIIIAENNLQFLEGLYVLISGLPNHRIVKTMTNGMELIMYPCLQEADIILIDIEMEELKGIEAAKYINQHYPGISMIALSMYLEDIYLKEIFETGFRAFIYKPDVVEKLPTVIEKILENKYWLSENLKVYNKDQL